MPPADIRPLFYELPKEYSVFLSSGHDAIDLRDRVSEIFKAADDILAYRNTGLRIKVRRWEDCPPHRSDGRVNAEFVERAMKSPMIVALLIDDIHKGTHEELTTVLTETKNEVAVLVFTEPGRVLTPELQKFKTDWGAKLVWKEAGPASEDKSWIEIVRLLVDLLIRISMSQPATNEREFIENR